MNSVVVHTHFICETENNNQLYFLDVLDLRENNTFYIIVYRKPFAVPLPLHRFSSHSPNQKLAVFNTYVYRALNICSPWNLLKIELNYNIIVAIGRGFSD